MVKEGVVREGVFRGVTATEPQYCGLVFISSALYGSQYSEVFCEGAWLERRV